MSTRTLRSTIVRKSTIAVALAGATVLIATPAVAAPGDALPEGQQITASVEFYDEITYGTLLASMNPVTAVATGLGTGAEHLAAEGGGDLDVDSNGFGYLISYTYFDDDDSGPVIVPADANTGALGTPVPITLDPASELAGEIVWCFGADYSAGVIRTICIYQDNDVEQQLIGTVTVGGLFLPEV